MAVLVGQECGIGSSAEAPDDWFLKLDNGGGCTRSPGQFPYAVRSWRVLPLERSPQPALPGDEQNPCNCLPPNQCPQCNGGNICRQAGTDGLDNGEPWEPTPCRMVLRSEDQGGIPSQRRHCLRQIRCADEFLPVTWDDRRRLHGLIEDRYTSGVPWAKCVNIDNDDAGICAGFGLDRFARREMRNIIPIARISGEAGAFCFIELRGRVPFGVQIRGTSNTAQFFMRLGVKDVQSHRGHIMFSVSFDQDWGNDGSTTMHCRTRRVRLLGGFPVPFCDTIVDMWEDATTDHIDPRTEFGVRHNLGAGFPTGWMRDFSVGVDLRIKIWIQRRGEGLPPDLAGLVGGTGGTP